MSWGKQDPWHLLACLPQASATLDPFNVTTPDLRAIVIHWEGQGQQLRVRQQEVWHRASNFYHNEEGYAGCLTGLQ